MFFKSKQFYDSVIKYVGIKKKKLKLSFQIQQDCNLHPQWEIRDFLLIVKCYRSEMGDKLLQRVVYCKEPDYAETSW